MKCNEALCTVMKYYKVLRNITKPYAYEVLQSVMMKYEALLLQSVTKCYVVLWSVMKCCKVLQSNYEVLHSVAKCYKVLRSVIIVPKHFKAL